MRTPPLILIVDDNPMNLDILQTRLSVHGYEIATAKDGEEALSVAREKLPDLILLDIMMPKVDGVEVCRRLKADASLPFMPIVMVTAKADSKDIVAGLDAGGDEYLTKPVDQASMVARVKSMLRIKALHDTVQEQTARLEAQSAQLAEWNRKLEQRVAEQVAELERFGRLKRFMSPQLAELIVSSGNEKLLESHRREITVVFCDLRGFTAFSETAEPEEVIGVLREYHAAMGSLIFQFEGTLERFAGDGMMVFFNDPVPCPDPAMRAVRMAVAMRQRASELADVWRKRGHQLDFGVGIATGYATLGAIGFEGRFDYGAIGPVTNLASRLCDEAKGGQILISQRVYSAVEELVDTEEMGKLSVKGFSKPVLVFNVVRLLEQPRPVPARTSDSYEECPSCGACYDRGTSRCTKDGANLVQMSFSRLLAGRYRAERRLGSGGMGTVYEAIDKALERPVAVKMIREDHISSPDAAERFRREALAAAGFTHPNVVTVHDFGVSGARAFLVMELLHGKTLREELQQQRLEAGRALRILSGVCAAVEAGHRRHVIHRDIKPENIFLVSSETGEIPKVLDFGLAKYLTNPLTEPTLETGAGVLMGTLHYMAPEQLQGGQADTSWDLWAVAALAYEMLTGVHPFAHQNLAESIGATLSGRFTPISDHLPQAPPSWQEFFDRALALDPNKRPDSARSLYSELERTLSQQG